MNWLVGSTEYYFLFLLLAPVIGLLLYFKRWKKRKIDDFAEQKFQQYLFTKYSLFSKVFPFLYVLMFVLIIISTLDIVGGNEVMKSEQRQSNDLFLIDVSNSMNTEDISPNRLTQAKNIVINSLKEIPNDRLGLVLFAGEARSIMPLTTDHSATEIYVSGIETSNIQTQGTDFLKAIQMVAKKFKNVPKGNRQVILLSDGEDNEGNEAAAANLAKKEGIRIISIGIGSEEGAPVPDYIYGQLMGYKTDRLGETVISKKQTKALKLLASETNGEYIDGNQLDEAVSELSKALKNTSESHGYSIYSQTMQHYYQLFLGIALLILCIILIFNPKRGFNF